MNSARGVIVTERGPGTQLVSGELFYPLDPRSSEIEIEDIAHSLAHQCRFNGHCKFFYSIAQHSLLVERFVRQPEHKLCALLHDATETYVGDLIKPIKIELPDFTKIEQQIWVAIATRYGLPAELPQCVKDADFLAFAHEMERVMSEPRGLKSDDLPNVDAVQIEYMSPFTAMTLFLERFYELRSKTRG